MRHVVWTPKGLLTSIVMLYLSIVSGVSRHSGEGTAAAKNAGALWTALDLLLRCRGGMHGVKLKKPELLSICLLRVQAKKAVKEIGYQLTDRGSASKGAGRGLIKGKAPLQGGEYTTAGSMTHCILICVLITLKLDGAWARMEYACIIEEDETHHS